MAKLPNDTLVQWFEEAEEASAEARASAERDRDYYDNKQLTEAELAELRKRGQPDIIINRIKRKVDFLTGFEAQQRTDPKAFPVTPNDEDAGEAATDALRFVEDRTDLDQKFSDNWENMLIEGYGGLELVVTEKRDQDGNPRGEIDAKRWKWDELFYDPHSREHDFSDATYKGGVKWFDAEVAKAMWPKLKGQIESTISDQHSVHGETYEDKPTWKVWARSGKRKRLRVVQMYYRSEGRWYWSHFIKGAELDGGVVPWVDADGESWCPLIMGSLYVDRDNNRYGIVREMVGPQDEVNKRRSKSLHMLSVRQTAGEAGVVEDVDAMKRELSRPDGHVQVSPGGLANNRFQLLDNSLQLNGHLQLLQEAKAEIDQMGPDAAVSGRQQDGDASGRALRVAQEGGIVEISRARDRHLHFKRRVYRGIWSLIRMVWTDERWVRVTDNEDNLRFSGFNRPVLLGDKLLKEFESQGMDPDSATEALAQYVEQTGQDPSADTGERENVPAEMYMDIKIENTSEAVNIQEEQFAGLTNLAQAGVTFPPEIYIRASSLRNKDELLKSFEQDEAVIEQQQQQKEIGDLTIVKLKAEIAALNAKALKDDASTDKTEADTDKTRVETALLAEQPPPDNQNTQTTQPAT